MISRSTVIGGLIVVELAIAGAAVGLFANPVVAPPLFFGHPAAPAEAAAPANVLNKSFLAGPAPRVVITMPSIPVTVEVGNAPTVQVKETLVRRGWVAGTPSRLAAEQTPDGVRIHNLDVGEVSAVFFGVFEHSVHVTVPPGAHVELTTEDTITVRGLRAKLVAHTHDGRINVTDHQGDLDVATDSGRIYLTDVQGAAIDAVSHDGRIYLTRVGADRLAVHSDSGRIIGAGIRALDGGLTTADGRIEVSITASSDATASVRAHDGRISVSGFPYTSDGDDRGTARFGAGRGHFDISTANGHVTITQGANG
jgi:Putative adhesin